MAGLRRTGAARACIPHSAAGAASCLHPLPRRPPPARSRARSSTRPSSAAAPCGSCSERFAARSSTRSASRPERSAAASCTPRDASPRKRSALSAVRRDTAGGSARTPRRSSESVSSCGPQPGVRGGGARGAQGHVSILTSAAKRSLPSRARRRQCALSLLHLPLLARKKKHAPPPAAARTRQQRAQIRRHHRRARAAERQLAQRRAAPERARQLLDAVRREHHARQLEARERRQLGRGLGERREDRGDEQEVCRHHQPRQPAQHRQRQVDLGCAVPRARAQVAEHERPVGGPGRGWGRAALRAAPGMAKRRTGLPKHCRRPPRRPP
jgi:hypothetical protein